MVTLSELKNLKIIIRADLDVPITAGQIDNDYRLQTLLPTLNLLLQNHNQLLIIGHLGRPQGVEPQFSLKPVHLWLQNALHQDILFVPSGFSPGEWWRGGNAVILLDNLRFDPREETLDRGFATDLATGADYYVYDAFATYRPCTSLTLLPEVLPTVPGLQFEKEIATLSAILQNPTHPTLLLASGAKADKLAILRQIGSKFDQVIYGGKFAPTTDLTPDGLDLNPEAINTILKAISEASTIVLNGPLGYFEDQVHAQATRAVYSALKTSSAQTILGGGDTLASIPALGFGYSDFSFVSTGGGSMLEFLASGTHPLLSVLHRS